MNEGFKLRNFFISLPFLWIILTFGYMSLTSGAYSGGLFSLGLWFGLFVPMAFPNFILAIAGTHSGAIPGIAVFPLMFVTIFGGEIIFSNLRLSPFIKFLSILFILFILTISVDFIIHGSWKSWEILNAGGMPQYIPPTY